MTETRRILTGLALGALAMLSTQMMPARAAVMVDASVTDQVGGVFNYAFSVTNDLADLAIVEIDAPLADTLITATLSPPAGYGANYDPGLGLLSFLPDTFLNFELGTVGLFTFASTAAPGTAFNDFRVFSETDIFANPGVPTQTGQVDLAQVQVPLPGGLALVALGLGLMAPLGRRA